MTIEKAYNSWAENYDTMENKTRDLEKVAAQKTLASYDYNSVLELGCGTGKNTAWLADNAISVLGLDFSEAMLTKAKQKIDAKNIEFKKADLTLPWDVADNCFDFATCSLTLEHIENLDFIFAQAYKKLLENGKFFICELHPFRQYMGSKAKYETATGIEELEVHTHHISEYVDAATTNGFKLMELQEWFDDDNKAGIPRLISFVFGKF